MTKKPYPGWLCIFSDTSATSRSGLRIRVAKLNEEKIMRPAMEEMNLEEQAAFVKLDEKDMLYKAAEKLSGNNRIFMIFELDEEKKFLDAALVLGIFPEAKDLVK